MCGYNLASDAGIGLDDLRAQLHEAKERYGGESFVKIYTSGSFLDSREIPLEFRGEVVDAFREAERILFESRPEFVTEENIQDLRGRKISVAMGLESGTDRVLRDCVRKGFTTADYERAALLLRTRGVPLRTYLLLKPLFLTEREAIEDARRSIAFASPYSESVSVNPVNVQKETVLEGLWRRGDYRPPWLWSLVEVLRGGKGTERTRVFSSPSGGGTPRGVHNCLNCDKDFLEAIGRFTFSQSEREFEGLDCRCRLEWRALVEVQDAMATSVDVDRYLSSALDLE